MSVCVCVCVCVCAMSACPSTYPPNSLSICLSVPSSPRLIHPFTEHNIYIYIRKVCKYNSSYVYIHLSVCASTYLPIVPFIYPPLNSFICLFVCLCIYLSISLSVCLFLSSSIHSSIHLPIPTLYSDGLSAYLCRSICVYLSVH